MGNESTLGIESSRASIREGRTALGIELGSTRIKAVLIDEQATPLASGNHDWENQLENGLWTYSLEDIWEGLQHCYRALADDVKTRYGESLTRVGSIGISAMMHGYMAFDSEGRLLVPFRTWRNTNTGQAAEALSDLFHFNIPLRWSIAHLYQAILDDEEHVSRIAHLFTLAAYIHWKLTGLPVVGIGDASGMFPIDSSALDYDATMVSQFDQLIAEQGYPWTLKSILPRVLVAGDSAGTLTEDGARLLDPTGQLQPGIPLCPPEGDAGTGMAATHSVAQRTGNVSAGTSIFGMFVLEKPLDAVYREIDMVTTPTGDPVAMVHCNNCTSDLDDWIGLFSEVLDCFKDRLSPDDDVNSNKARTIDKSLLYERLFRKALEAENDGGGLVAYNYLSGEPITRMKEGRPLFLRFPDSRLSLANFMRTQLYAALATLHLGLDILLNRESVRIDSITGHGGFFKTPGVGQRMLAAAMNASISVMETAGEGGAWGMALLAAFMLYRKPGQSLDDYLGESVFSSMTVDTLPPDLADVAGFDRFMERYKACLPVEREATNCLSLRPESAETNDKAGNKDDPCLKN